MRRTRVIIMGAAGRDFHNFNVVFRDKPEYEVVAFTAAQIPGIAGRRYPPELAGPLYPQGIPIEPEERLFELVKAHQVDRVVFAYSDVSHQYVMERAAIAQAAGADFWLLGPSATQLSAKKPVVAVCAVRTGCGKSQTTRKVTRILKSWGKKVVVVRHPMPYGDLRQQVAQRFADFSDLDRYRCTIEEREEFEPHLREGTVVYAGVDYEKILRMAEEEADVIVWDGGNNDFPFFKTDILIVVTDPLRAGHERTYWPGSVNIRMADVVEEPELVARKRVLVVEDGPTVTHGEMPFGAGAVAARKLRATLVDPRPYAVNSIKEAFELYPHLGPVLPAMGYGDHQIQDLAETIRRVPCDAILIATPVDLRRLLDLPKPATRVRYELQEIGHPTLEEVLRDLL
jgi:predicted GTPase